jgi:hypothetical protein
MHAAIRPPLAAGIALVGAGTIAASPIAAPPPDVHISDVRLTLSTQLMQANPVTAGERLVGQTAYDSEVQAARVVTFPIARALVLNVTHAVGGGRVATASRGVTASNASATTRTTAAAVAGGGQVLQNLVVDGVDTTLRLIPASAEAGIGVAVSTINAVVQTDVASARAVLNVGAAMLTLNPVTVLNTAALGAVRVAAVVEHTTIGTPVLEYKSQSDTAVAVPVRSRTPSILTAVLNGRDEIANAIYPVARRALASTAQDTTASTTTAAAADTATSTSVTKAVAKPTSAGPKHAKK